MHATYINGHLRKGADPYRASDLIPWSEPNHVKATGEFLSGGQLLAALNRK